MSPDLTHNSHTEIVFIKRSTEATHTFWPINFQDCFSCLWKLDKDLFYRDYSHKEFPIYIYIKYTHIFESNESFYSATVH